MPTRRNCSPMTDGWTSVLIHTSQVGQATMNIRGAKRLAGAVGGAGRRVAGVLGMSLAVVIAAFSLSTADAAVNTWKLNDNLGTGSNWSAGSAPSGNGNAGSYQDAVFASASTTGTTSSATSNLYLQSVNVTNGSSYRFSPGRPRPSPSGWGSLRAAPLVKGQPSPTAFRGVRKTSSISRTTRRSRSPGPRSARHQ